MKFYIIIPAHNEEDSIAQTLDSLLNQSLVPKQVVVVNDNSSDLTQAIVEDYANKYNWITLVNLISSDKHLPGAKIINAFYKGYDILDEDYDVICKYDADLIFPKNYLEHISNHFKANERLGMASGFCHINKNDKWFLENLTGKDHIRGALKAYRKACFIEIGKLKPAMGWDTADELLAKFYNWQIFTDETLKVKHLKPTGISYSKDSKYLQGEAMYKLRNGFILTYISALKMGFKKKSFRFFKDYITGYIKATQHKPDYLVTKEQGAFIRKLRWKGILKKFI